MKIKDFPLQNRPRERFKQLGPTALSDSELFALILRTGSRGKKDENGVYQGGENVIDMSNRLIAEYGLINLFDCSLKELQKIKGIGPDKAVQILAISELGKRYNHMKNNHNPKKITCPEDVFNLMHERLKDEKQEHFYIIMLNTHNNIIGEPLLITKGILDATIIHPREVFRPAIKNAASKIILVHNHPSGDPFPSGQDLGITNKLKEVGEVLDIALIDHVIIGRESGWSCETNKKL